LGGLIEKQAEINLLEIDDYLNHEKHYTCMEKLMSIRDKVICHCKKVEMAFLLFQPTKQSHSKPKKLRLLRSLRSLAMTP
jgi:hypothetical protein